MSHGIELLSPAIGRVLDQDSIVPYTVAAGYRALTKSGAFILPLEYTLPIAVGPSPPLVLIRPDTADRYVGGFSGGFAMNPPPSPTQSTTPVFSMTGQSGFHWRVLSVLGTPIQDATQYGMEVYRSNGSVAYSSRRQHMRLRQIASVSAASLVNQEIYVPLVGFTSRPWFVANDLLVTYSGVGDSSEFVPALMARVNASNTGMYLCWRDYADNATNPGFRKLDSSNSDFGQYNSFFYGTNFFVSLYENEEV